MSEERHNDVQEELTEKNEEVEEIKTDAEEAVIKTEETHVVEVETSKETQNNQPPQPQCPKCKSTALYAGKKGFGIGKAAVGGLLVGPVGLLAGVIGMRKIKLTCLNCGHSWTLKSSS